MIKKQTMISYTVLPTDKQAPLSPMRRCPKLTRYKLVGIVTVFTFTIFMMVNTLIRMDEAQIRDTTKAFTFYSISLYQSNTNNHNLVRYTEDEPTYNIINTDTGYSESGRANIGSGDQRTYDRYMKKRLPSAIVIGARKAGTRALLRFINLHSGVAASRQETHFFDRYYDEGLDWYKQQMPYSYEGQVTIEKTPNYFVDWLVPERVYNFSSSIKLILIVRNPIDRAVSDYVQLKEKFLKSGHGDFFGSFEDLAFDKYTGEINKSYAPIKRSLYTRHLEKWLHFFQMSQLLVVDGENIKARPWEEMYKLESFLGLSHQIGKERFVYNKTKGFYCVRLEKRSKSVKGGQQIADFLVRSEQCLADSKGRSHPVIHRDFRLELLNFFKPFNNRFFAAIGKTFNWA